MSIFERVLWMKSGRAGLAIATLAALAALTACAPAAPGQGDNLSAQNEEVLPDDPTEEGAEVVPGLTDDEIANVMAFKAPSFSAQEMAAILEKYAFVDPGNQVPDKLLKEALYYYEANKSNLANKTYLSVIDFSKRSTNQRFFVINMSNGSVWAMHVAHGKGSDSNHDGYAEKFSNTSGSKMSSLGFYKTAETYSGSNGFSLRLDGLSSTNSRARSRAIVVHGASYVKDKSAVQGRSWGCPAVSMANRTKLINTIKGGSLIYAGLSN